MYQDNPEDLCSERLMGAVYKGTPLARPILGTRASLEKMTGAWLREYMRDHYLPGDIVVSLAGSFPELVVEELKARFLALEGGKSPAPRPAGYTPAFTLKKRPSSRTT